MEPDDVREVFRGSLIRVEVESWPAGRREVVRHPGACAVVALTPQGDVILVRQFRESVRKTLLEIPAGVLDVQGEDAEACVARELVEETGWRAVEVAPLATIVTSPGFADERIELFLARAEPVPEAGPTHPPWTPEAGVEPIVLPLVAALAAAEDGRIVDAKTIAGLLLARSRLQRGSLSPSASG